MHDAAIACMEARRLSNVLDTNEFNSFQLGQRSVGGLTFQAITQELVTEVEQTACFHGDRNQTSPPRR